jgi:hypothetical protein
MEVTVDEFGCGECLPAEADRAWEAVRSLVIELRLIDESHFNVILRSCSSCHQRFVSVFFETIDWADGEDPQFWTVLPITEGEAERLSRAGDQVVSELTTLAPTRRSLCRDFPKGEKARTYWSSGLPVRHHD